MGHADKKCSIRKKGQPVGRAVARSFLEQEVWGSNLEPVKLGSVANGSSPLLHFFERGCVARAQ